MSEYRSDLGLEFASGSGDYSYGSPIEGHSYNGNDIRGFWVRLRVPSGQTITKIKVNGVSSNFDPVIGVKTNCSYDYIYDSDSSYQNSQKFADGNANGGGEVFDNWLDGPSNNDDGIYHIRFYHYKGSETPTITFDIETE